MQVLEFPEESGGLLAELHEVHHQFALPAVPVHRGVCFAGDAALWRTVSLINRRPVRGYLKAITCTTQGEGGCRAPHSPIRGADVGLSGLLRCDFWFYRRIVPVLVFLSETLSTCYNSKFLYRSIGPMDTQTPETGLREAALLLGGERQIIFLRARATGFFFFLLRIFFCWKT